MSSPTNEQGSPESSVIIPAGPQRERLKFADFVFARTPSGPCTAEVHLEFDGVPYVGRALGQSSLLGDFRVAAEAALHALADYTKGAMTFDLLGVKHLRAFDENLIIVSITMREPSRVVKLVGCALAETDTRRCAALAVLNATNRVLGNYIAAQ